MPRRRTPYTTKHARKTSRQVNDSTLGTHVQRRTYSQRDVRSHSRNQYTQAVLRRARIKRFAIIAVIAVVVVGLAVAVGLFVFRNVVGGELSLKNSNAGEALVAVRSDKPSYALITAELGATAVPLEAEGPEVLLLARLDPQAKKMALVSIPAGLQMTIDNKSESVSAIAARSDAELIKSLSTFMKIDISHFVKLQDEQSVAGLVDALGGVRVDVTQPIDDPNAGHICLPEGAQTLNGESALVFLRATNIEYGAQDRLVNQLKFSAQLMADVFTGSRTFGTKLESIGKFIQTDLSYGDLESINSLVGGVSADDISTAVLPGYYTVVTNVTGVDDGRFVSSSSDVAELMSALDENAQMDAGSARQGEAAEPSSFTVDVQNGTSIEGAASAAADLLKKAGFKVGDVGNADQPIYEETLVVYRGDDAQGAARARAVIEALGSGRAVDGDAYYEFKSDVLLVIGADNKPIS